MDAKPGGPPVKVSRTPSLREWKVSSEATLHQFFFSLCLCSVRPSCGHLYACRCARVLIAPDVLAKAARLGPELFPSPNSTV